MSEKNARKRSGRKDEQRNDENKSSPDAVRKL